MPPAYVLPLQSLDMKKTAVSRRRGDAEASRPAEEKRRHTRLPCSHEATLTVGAWPRRRTLSVQAIDFSSAGARVTLSPDASLKAGAQVRLHCVLPDDPAGTRPHRLDATVVGAAGAMIGLRFDRHVGEQADAATTRRGRRSAIAVAIILALLMCLIKVSHLHRFWYASWVNLYSLLTCAFLVSRMVISSFYKEPEDNNYRPTVSIVIAVMNEEACIVRTVEGCLRSHYPAKLLEVIVVDDGSTDGTWRELLALRARRPSVKLLQFEKNRGKRHAMAAGIAIATGEVLLFVDSDSTPDPEGVYRLVQPLADPSVGAVSGHVEVIVEEHNLISKMESVRYYLGHRFIKGAESLFGAVSCCPGPFSAYRRDAVLKILDGWLNQKFMGVPATFGDDRSLTLRILRDYRVLFHFGARCRTTVPDRWLPFFKQQLRWKKSWMRELPYALRTMCSEHPVAAFSYAASAIITLLSPLVLFYSLVYLPVYAGAQPLYYILGFLASYVCLSLVCYYQTGTPVWFYGPVSGAVYMCVMVWQNYYAILTINKTAWGTR